MNWIQDTANRRETHHRRGHTAVVNTHRVAKRDWWIWEVFINRSGLQVASGMEPTKRGAKRTAESVITTRATDD